MIIDFILDNRTCDIGSPLPLSEIMVRGGTQKKYIDLALLQAQGHSVSEGTS